MSETIVPGRVIWITGLSGSGKSTLGRSLHAHLRTQGVMGVYLDGDVLREVFADNRDYTRAGRLQLAWKYSYLCQMLALQGLTVICATISLFHVIHAWNREHLPGYFEVLLDVPFDILRERDPNQIYSRALAGELDDVVGVDLLPEWPLRPDVVLACADRPTPEKLLAHLHAIL
jgi:adenylylsulfate kinase-like enzyme